MQSPNGWNGRAVGQPYDEVATTNSPIDRLIFLAMRFFTLFAPTCFVAKDNRCFELMQICDLIADYLQIKVTCLCLHFLTDGYGKEINLAKPVREICENAKFSKDNNSSVT